MATPALRVGASTSNNACGSWWIYRLTFSGGPFPAGTLLDYPILGQDSNALLLSTDNFAPASRNRTVFGLQKSGVYSGAAVSFSTFGTSSFTAPVSNAGIPMISTPFSYFLGSVPGTGYQLYRLTNSGGPGATSSLQATISSTFSAPPRRVNQARHHHHTGPARRAHPVVAVQRRQLHLVRPRHRHRRLPRRALRRDQHRVQHRDGSHRVPQRHQ
jgi:hypothetical protein